MSKENEWTWEKINFVASLWASDVKFYKDFKVNETIHNWREIVC